MKLDEAKKISDACIYRFVYPNGLSYVGQTKCLRDRLCLYESQLYGSLSSSKSSSRHLDALLEYGFDNVDIEVLCYLRNLSGEDLLLCLSILEIKYIREYDTFHPRGYNVSIGGEILGIPIDLISTSCSSSMNNRPVLVYDLDGNFVSEYPSISKCAYHLGSDSDTVSSKLDKRGSLLLNQYLVRSKRYGEIPQKIVGFKPKVVEKVKVKNIVEEHVVYKEKTVQVTLPTLKYNLDGVFCGEYETRIDAALSIGRRNISYGVPIRGYIFFKHDGGEIKQNIGKIEIKSKRLPKYSDAINRDDDVSPTPVYRSGWTNLINAFTIEQWDLYGNYVATFDSIKDASEKTGLAYSGIWSCVMGKTRKSQGYIWRRVEDE